MRTSTYGGFGLILVVALVAAFAAPAAMATNDTVTDPSTDVYPQPTPDPLGTETTGTSGTAGTGAEGGGGSPGSPAVAAEEDTGLNSSIGSLPFTGLDLLILGGVALVLTGTGLALRRLSSSGGPTA